MRLLLDENYTHVLLTHFWVNLDSGGISLVVNSSVYNYPMFQHPFLRLAKPLLSLVPLIMASKESQKGHSLGLGS